MSSSCAAGIMIGMTPDTKKIVMLVQDIINDDDLKHLKIGDLRSIIIHVTGNVFSVEDSDESDEDLNRYVI